MEEDLGDHFKAKVSIEKQNTGGGKIVIPFRSDNDLKRIAKLLDL